MLPHCLSLSIYIFFNTNNFFICSYGFTMGKLVCLGYVHSFSDNRNRNHMVITNDYLLSPTAKYEIDVAGIRFPVVPKIHTPHINATMPKVSNNSRYVPKVVSHI